MNNVKKQSTKVWLNEVSLMRPVLLVLLVSYHAFAPYAGTQLHLIVMQIRGWRMERMEEIKSILKYKI